MASAPGAGRPAGERMTVSEAAYLMPPATAHRRDAAPPRREDPDTLALASHRLVVAPGGGIALCHSGSVGQLYSSI